MQIFKTEASKKIPQLLSFICKITSHVAANTTNAPIFAIQMHI